MVSPFTMSKKNIEKKALKKSGRPKTVVSSSSFDMVPPVCKHCQLLGSTENRLKFCSRCLGGFHSTCIGVTEPTLEEPFVCSDCLQNKVRCFCCKEYCHLTDGILRCSQKNCKKYFHEKCAKKWETLRGANSSMSRRSYTCPQHSCHKCHRSMNWGPFRLIRCLSCPVAYHKNCSPRHANILEDVPGFLLCKRHRINQMSGDAGGQMSVFTQLPIPDVPVDFQVPESIKKRKLLDYTYIKRNFYIAKKHQDDVGSMLCKCSGGSCGFQCLCMHAHYSCTASCNCKGNCDNKAFHLRKAKKLKMTMTEKCGWGIKAGEDIKEGEFLIEYVGEVIDDKQCEARLWKMKNAQKTNFYLCEINREMVIDATYRGNKSRFINHSCRPNTELQKWQNDGETRIGIFAISNIKKGEYVTYDYQFINFGTTQECFCGASDCRGFLGVKPSRQKLSSDAATKIVTEEIILSNLKRRTQQSNNSYLKEGYLAYASKGKSRPKCIGLRVRIWWPEDEMYYKGEIVAYAPVTDTHTIVYDDGEIEHLVMSKEIWEVDLPYLPEGKLQDCDVSINSVTNITSSANGTYLEMP